MEPARREIEFGWLPDLPTQQHGPLTTNLTRAVQAPGTWWLIATFATARAAEAAVSEFRGGRNGRRRPALGRWECARRKAQDGPGRFGLWLRYLAPGDEEER